MDAERFQHGRGLKWRKSFHTPRVKGLFSSLALPVPNTLAN
jgi:hypothetical protein